MLLNEPHNFSPLLEVMKLEYQSLREEIESSISKHFQIPVFQLFSIGISVFIQASTDISGVLIASVLIAIITPTLSWWGAEQHRMMRAASYLRELEGRINRLFEQWYENEPRLAWTTALGWENWIIPQSNHITAVLAKNVHEILFLVGVALIWAINAGLTGYIAYELLISDRLTFLAFPISFAVIEVALAPFLFTVPLHRKPLLDKRIREKVHQHIKQYSTVHNGIKLNLPNELKPYENTLLVFDFNGILFSTRPNESEQVRLRYGETAHFVNLLSKIDARFRTAIITGNSYRNVFRHLSSGHEELAVDYIATESGLALRGIEKELLSPEVVAKWLEDIGYEERTREFVDKLGLCNLDPRSWAAQDNEIRTTLKPIKGLWSGAEMEAIRNAAKQLGISFYDARGHTSETAGIKLELHRDALDIHPSILLPVVNGGMPRPVDKGFALASIVRQVPHLAYLAIFVDELNDLPLVYEADQLRQARRRPYPYIDVIAVGDCNEELKAPQFERLLKIWPTPNTTAVDQFLAILLKWLRV